MPATLTVTTTADETAPNDAPSVSLREAILSINNRADAGADVTANRVGAYGSNDTINFNIPGAGVQVLSLLSSLPSIVKPVTINGYSQPGSTVNTLLNADNALLRIQIDGMSAGTAVNGLTLGPGSGGSTIEGLDVTGFSADANFNGGDGILVESNGNRIVGNYLGVNAAGTVQVINGADGISVLDASNNQIGGTSPADRNIASGNVLVGVHIIGSITAPSIGNVIQGNFLGVAADGVSSVGTRTKPIPTPASIGSRSGNFFFGIELTGADNTLVGGTTAGAQNVAGFNDAGIEITDGSQSNVIQGNYVGVGADGLTPTPNNLHGIVLHSTNGIGPPLGPAQPNEPGVSFNLIGGTTAGAGNLVEFNGAAGVGVYGNPVSVSGQPSIGNAIEGNTIYLNGRLDPSVFVGIDLTNGFLPPFDDGVTPNDSAGHGAANDPNNFQNFPVLTSALSSNGQTTIAGTLHSAAHSAYRIEFFASAPDPRGGIPEGQRFLGFLNVTTDANGLAVFSAAFNVSIPVGHIITATATDGIGNTSEFSAGLVVPTGSPYLAVGADAGGAPQVVVYNAGTGALVASFDAFAPSFTGGVRVAVADVNGDGVPDVICAAGPGGGPQVTMFDGQTFQPIVSFEAFAPSFTGGVFVAAATSSSGQTWIAAAAGAGGGPQVVVFTVQAILTAAATGTAPMPLTSFYAFAPGFSGGVTVALGDVNGDGTLDVIAGAGPGGGPQVVVIDGTQLGAIPSNGVLPGGALLASFFAFTPSFTGGVFVSGGATAGTQFNLIVGAGAGAGPQVIVVNGALLGQLASNGVIAGNAVLDSFFALASGFSGGVRVGFDAAYGSSNQPAILSAAGPGGGPQVAPFDGITFQALASFFALPPGFAGGLFVAG